MWAKMPDKAFISKDGRNAEAMPEKLEPQNLKVYLDASSFYHVQGLVETQNNKQIFFFFFFLNSLNISGHLVLIPFGVLLRASQIFLFEPTPSFLFTLVLM